jgi:hypothetical protein
MNALSLKRACDGPLTRTLTYTRPTTAARYYPMLWVHVREEKVREVNAKRYGHWFWLLDDDLGIYGLSADQRYEKPEFAEVFPQ